MLFCLFILAPVSIWSRSHDHHHKHNSKLINSTIGSYPTLSKQQFLKASKKDWYTELSKAEQKEIQIGISQADANEFVSHKEVMAKFAKWH